MDCVRLCDNHFVSDCHIARFIPHEPKMIIWYLLIKLEGGGCAGGREAYPKGAKAARTPPIFPDLLRRFIICLKLYHEYIDTVILFGYASCVRAGPARRSPTNPARSERKQR